MQTMLTYCVKCIGVILLLAAASKMVPMLDCIFFFRQTISEMTLLQQLSFSAVAFELWLGLRLLQNSPDSSSIALSAGLFFVFTVASVALMTAGVADCGCLGRVSTLPLQKILLNIVCLSLLAYYYYDCHRRGHTQSSENSPSGHRVRDACIASITFAGMSVVAYLTITFGGARPIAERVPMVAAFAVAAKPHELADYRRFSVPVKNLTSSTINIEGGSQYCGLHVATDFPFSLGPGESADIEIEAKNATKAETIKLQFSLFGHRGSGVETFNFGVLGNWDARP